MDYLSLFKPRIVVLLLFLAGVAATAAWGAIPPWERLLPLLAAGSLSSGGAAALNNYLDRDVDALMERTKNRPLPSGRIKQPRLVLLLGMGLILLSLPLSLSLSPYVALFTLSGAAIYVVVYTYWLKRRSPWNVVIGGAAGSCAVLAGWGAVASPFSPLPLLMAGLVFLWTPLHFWNFSLLYRPDYQRAGIPMLPAKVGEARAIPPIATAAAALFLFSLIPFLGGYLGRGYLLAAVATGVLLWGNGLLLARPSLSLAWRNYKLSGLYLALLFLAIAAEVLT